MAAGLGRLFGSAASKIGARKSVASGGSKAAANKKLLNELPGGAASKPPKSTPIREQRANRKWEQKQAKQEKINTKNQNTGNTGTPPAGQTTLPNGQPLPGGVKTDGKGGYLNAENKKVNAQGRLIDKNGNRINADGSALTRGQKIKEHFGNNANMYMLGGTTALMGAPMLMSGSGSGSSSGSGSDAEARPNAGNASSYDYAGGGSYGIPGSLYA